MKVKEIMTQTIETVTPDTAIRDAAQLMQEVNTDFLAVSENDELVGTLTGRDIVSRVVAEGQDPNVAHVHEAMSKDLTYCFEDDNVIEAVTLMNEKKISELPVLNRDKYLVGVLPLSEMFSFPFEPEGFKDVIEPLVVECQTQSAEILEEVSERRKEISALPGNVRIPPPEISALPGNVRIPPPEGQSD